MLSQRLVPKAYLKGVKLVNFQGAQIMEGGPSWAAVVAKSLAVESSNGLVKEPMIESDSIARWAAKDLSAMGFQKDELVQ
ncbi:hypothetical protein V6N13_008992 [Hibiscus sabdariffa]